MSFEGKGLKRAPEKALYLKHRLGACAAVKRRDGALPSLQQPLEFASSVPGGGGLPYHALGLPCLPDASPLGRRFPSRATLPLKGDAFPPGRRFPSRATLPLKGDASPLGRRFPSRATLPLKGDAFPPGRRFPSRATLPLKGDASPLGRRVDSADRATRHGLRTTPDQAVTAGHRMRGGARARA